jgi:hypothetical protein
LGAGFLGVAFLARAADLGGAVLARAVAAFRFEMAGVRRGFAFGLAFLVRRAAGDCGRDDRFFPAGMALGFDAVGFLPIIRSSS